MANILVVSPQPWDHIFISKHHYAVELARVPGNKVFFLNPPLSGRSKKVEIKPYPYAPLPNLYIVNYQYFFPVPLFFRYKLKAMYNIFMWITASAFIKKALPRIDEVWCFEPNVFPNLKVFGAKKNIFFPVDMYEERAGTRICRTATGVVTVSESLMEPVQKVNVPKLLINHGLAYHFKVQAEKNLEILQAGGLYFPCEKIKAGFFGNLLVPQIDTATFRNIISENPGVEFHFWGTFDYCNSQEVPVKNKDFVQFLHSAANVCLHGPVSSETLCAKIQDLDCFLLCYDMNFENKGNNSHKIIECLSTGKVIISNHFGLYKDKPELLVMPSSHENDGLPQLFQMVVHDITLYNDVTRQTKRIAYALENTYERHISSIGSFMNTNIHASLGR